MHGVIGRYEILKAAQRQPFHLDLVEEAAEFAPEPQRLIEAGRRVRSFEDFPREQDLAAHHRDCRRHIAAEGFGAFFRRGHHQLLGIEIAERAHARQKQRPAVADAQERLAQAAHRAPSRQQDLHARKRQRLAAALLQQPFGQGIDEGDARGQIENRGPA